MSDSWTDSCLSHVTSWTVAHQAPPSLGFPRQEYRSGLPCPPPGDLPDPGIEPMSLTSLALQVNSLPLAPPGKLKSWPIAVTLKSAGYQHDNSFHAQSCCSVIKQTCEVRTDGGPPARCIDFCVALGPVAVSPSPSAVPLALGAAPPSRACCLCLFSGQHG